MVRHEDVRVHLKEKKMKALISSSVYLNAGENSWGIEGCGELILN